MKHINCSNRAKQEICERHNVIYRYVRSREYDNRVS